MAPNRNALCSCGSGKKYKQCCAKNQQKSTQWVAIISVVAFVAIVAWAVAGVLRTGADSSDATAGKVWSEEHGHWHDTAAGDSAAGHEGHDHAASAGEGGPQHIWSEEHGHWHDVNPDEVAQPTVDPSGFRAQSPEQDFLAQLPGDVQKYVKRFDNGHKHWHFLDGTCVPEDQQGPDPYDTHGVPKPADDPEAPAAE